MLLSSSQNGTSATVVAVLLIMLGVGFVLVRYVEWSSNARFAEFMNATDAPATHSAPIPPLKGLTGCGQGKKSAPAPLSLLPGQGLGQSGDVLSSPSTSQ
jgi:hypothetical protein